MSSALELILIDSLKRTTPQNRGAFFRMLGQHGMSVDEVMSSLALQLNNKSFNARNFISQYLSIVSWATSMDADTNALLAEMGETPSTKPPMNSTACAYIARLLVKTYSSMMYEGTASIAEQIQKLGLFHRAIQSGETSAAIAREEFIQIYSTTVVTFGDKRAEFRRYMATALQQEETEFAPSNKALSFLIKLNTQVRQPRWNTMGIRLFWANKVPDGIVKLRGLLNDFNQSREEGKHRGLTKTEIIPLFQQVITQLRQKTEHICLTRKDATRQLYLSSLNEALAIQSGIPLVSEQGSHITMSVR